MKPEIDNLFMPNADIPEIRNLPEVVLAGVGEGLHVYIHDNDPSSGAVHSSHEMVTRVVDDLFMRERIPRNSNLERLCMAAARIAVAKLAASPGFRIEFGDWTDNNPRQIIDVKLRPDIASIVDAEVTTHSQE